MVVGVTGNVGSGKTTFVKELQKLGARVVDADSLAKKIVEENKSVREALKRKFGPDIFDEEDSLIRTELARRAFSNPVHYQALNRIMWPPLLNRIRNEISSIRNQYPQDLVVLDMAVLFESGASEWVDSTLVVRAPWEKRIRWIAKERNWSEDELTRRVSFQMDDPEKACRADCVIENNGSIDSLGKKAKDYYTEILVK